MRHSNAEAKRREYMVRKILRHAEVERFGESERHEDQMMLFAGLESPRGRDGRGRFERRSKALLYLVSEAYLSMFRILPEDHVVADPLLNREFVERCRVLGAVEPEEMLNRKLLRARKDGEHTGIQRQLPAPLCPSLIDGVSAAAELAARMTQLTVLVEHGVEPSVDSILCNPGFRDVFDSHALRLAPNNHARTLRLALLSLRKTGRETVKPAQTLAAHPPIAPVRLDALDPTSIPEVSGVYRLRTGRSFEFISWTSNLRDRLSRHASIANGRLVPAEWNAAMDCPVTAELYPIEGGHPVMQRIVHSVKQERRPRWNLSLAS